MPKIARIYLRVSTNEQDLGRQERIVNDARDAGYYIAGVYREKASGANMERSELKRMLADLQPGDVIIAERIDRLSRLPLPEAEALIDTIRQKGAKLSIPGVVDLSQFSEHLDPIAKIVLDATQEMLLKISLQIARDDYEIRRKRQQEGISQAKQSYPSKYQGRRPDPQLHERVHSLRAVGHTWKETARLAGCSVSYAKALGREMKGKLEM